jgi:Zn-dependent protease
MTQVRGLLSPPDEAIFRGQARDNTELLKAWAGTTLAYAITQVGATRILSNLFLIFLLIAAIVCGLGFVLHELGHRIVARRYGAQAHFVANNAWLLISIAIAFAGIFIAAPGAVWYRGYLTKAHSGHIALAGPVANFGLAVLFLVAFPLLHALGVTQSDAALLGAPLPVLVYLICSIGAGLNAFIGLFNMIPAGPFDGAKVLEWSPLVFGVTVAVGLVLTFVVRPETIWRLLGVPLPF